MSFRLSRRAFLGALAGAGVGAAAMASGTMRDTTGEFVVRHQDVTIDDLPTAFQHYRIGLITDLHYGAAIPDQWVRQALDLALEERVDLLIFGGDFLWIPDSPTQLHAMVHRNPAIGSEHGPEAVERAYALLAHVLGRPQLPDGAFAVLGNHDGWLGPGRCRAALQSSGIQLLVNELHTIRRGDSTLQLYGADDYWTGVPRQPDWRRDPKSVRLLVSHNPDYVSELAADSEAEPFDLALCGHTHGGQIVWPVLGALFYNVWDTRLKSGLFKGEKWHCFTSAGVGMVEIPYRFNCPAEVAVLTLKGS